MAKFNESEPFDQFGHENVTIRFTMNVVGAGQQRHPIRWQELIIIKIIMQ